MSIQEVRKIIGGDGEENKLTDTITEITYKSIDGITNGEVKFSFKDDKLFSIGDFAYASSESKTYQSDQIKTQIIPMKVFPQQHFLQIII